MNYAKLHEEFSRIQNQLRTTPLDLTVLVWGKDFDGTDLLRFSLTEITSGECKAITYNAKQLLLSTENESLFALRTYTRLTELIGYRGKKVQPPKPQPPPMKNYNNLISLAQDNIMTTVEVRLVNEGLSSAGYIYKLPLSIPAEEGNLVVVPTGGSAESCFKVGIIVKKHDLPLIDPNFSGEYRWVVSLVSEDARVAYSTQLQKEEEMILRLKDGEKRAATIKAKQEILSNLSLEDKQILGLEAKPLDNPS